MEKTEAIQTGALPTLWDCHTHIFGPWSRFPLPPQPTYRPPEAPFDTLRTLHGGMGIARGVIVQGGCYGDDHSALLAALRASGGAYRGIAVIGPDTPAAVLRDMHDAGVRGVRLGMMRHLGHGAGGFDGGRLRAIAARIAPLGWHALIYAEPADTFAALQHLEGCGVPLVVDHMARLPAGVDTQSADYGQLLHWLASPAVWIKVSGADRISGGHPEQGLPLMRRLLQAAPSRAIWGSDWPHVNVSYAMPDDAGLLALVRQACDGDAAMAHGLLSANPERLYA